MLTEKENKGSRRKYGKKRKGEVNIHGGKKEWWKRKERRENMENEGQWNANKRGIANEKE